jgi:hypothetical protein
MARQPIDIGIVGNDGTGDSIRDSFRKVNDNFKELYSSLGLGERLQFIGLSDTPNSYAEGEALIDEQNDSAFTTPVLTLKNTRDGIQFKKIIGGEGIEIDWDSDENQIAIVNSFKNIASFWSAQPNQNLGGDLSARAGDNQYRIRDLPVFNRNWLPGDPGSPGGPVSAGEAVSKSYVDSFVSRDGINAIDPATFRPNPALGRMRGPLILARSPEPEDDELYDGLVAATKRYVDQASFGSATNVYVSTSGSDSRGNLPIELQGSSLSYAYRSIESALRKAEQLMNEAPADIGPYKKTLTYGDNPNNKCTLDFIRVSPDSGTGFAANVLMSADQVTLLTPGTAYFAGDILDVVGGATGDSPVRILVLATSGTDSGTTSGIGSITSFRVISGGLYSGSLPINNVTTTISVSGGPQEIGPVGVGATFSINYKVNSINITNQGSNYGLVSVRISGGGGSGAFGTADVNPVTGAIESITITDQGSGFTGIPTVVANLPRFCIFTNGQRTDFTGDVLNNDAEAIRTRDIREGLYLKGERSGAIAQILAHNGDLGNDLGVPAQERGFSQKTPQPGVDLYELFDVDILFGSFQEGEVISYGDITVTRQVSVLVESGVYEENFPLKVPRNVAIIGDEFRRVIIKPKNGMSTSPWVFSKFRRDRTVGDFISELEVDDKLDIADRVFGYHYLTDSSRPVWPRINNRGSYIAAPALLQLNKSFIQEEVVTWIDQQINPIDGSQPTGIWQGFTYDRGLCRRDVGLLLDAMIYDLKYGEFYKTVSAALKYEQSASSIKAITDQYFQTIAAINRINVIAQKVLANEDFDNLQTSFGQVIDPGFVTESSAFGVFSALISTVNGVISDLRTLKLADWESGDPVPGGLTLNPPKSNDQLDVFLCNDANIVRAVTCQGHGGFMMVLDPTGQILTKSPYCQESASFSRSINKQIFAGGQLVDGFAGNLQFKHEVSLHKLINANLTGPGGNGYQEGDILRLDGGTSLLSKPAKLRVQTVGPGGNVTSFTIADPGSYETPPSNPVAVISETGSGNGAGFITEFAVTRLRVSGLDRFPELPSSFLVNDEVYRINYVRDFLYNPLGSTATLVLDDSTPFPFEPGEFACTISSGTPAIVTKNEHRLQAGSTIVFSGNSLPAGIVAGQEYYVLQEGLSDNDFRITETLGSLDPVSTTSSGSGTYQRLYEILTPGNRSMLSNDFTQINDLGYGLVATNGGLIEAVGMFTYYNWISYYSINGGQIRSVGGSSAHGKYALVAAGSDPLEVPTPTSLYEKYSQGATVYAPNSSFENKQGQFLIWVTDYDYTPLSESEIEIDHGGTIGIVRYPVGAISIADLPNGIARLNISNQDGLAAAVPNGTRVTIRCVTNIILTGDLTNVSVRPSTGLIMNDIPTQVYRVLEFNTYNDPNGPYDFTVNNGLFQATSGSHRLREGYEIKFSNELGPLPTPINPALTYYVIGTDLNADTGTFRISSIRNGDSLITTDGGSAGQTYNIFGLTSTRLREPYNYIELEIFDPGEFSGNVSTGDGECTFSAVPGNDIVVSTSSPHGLSAGDVIKFEVANRSTDSLPSGLTLLAKYHVLPSGLTGTSFRVSLSPGGDPIIAGSSSGTGTFYYGKILGLPGDNQITISGGLGSIDTNRVIGSQFVFLGNEYTITGYQNEELFGTPFGLVTFDPPLSTTPGVKSPVQYGERVTLLAGSPPGVINSDGTLTVRISLTRVTGHDLLDIGTGSYADTNYPNEIYGPPVNPVKPSNETQERGVGRTFYVTTDQFGNFSVGPFFRVDQGTGTVTFSAQIAISNLNGLGFKRGVTVSEFSTDTNFEGAGKDSGALDKVPVEFAQRIYLERRLGVRHTGGNVPEGELIPSVTGGFMALSGQLPMKSNMSLGNNRIVNVQDPTDPQDAVNKRYLKFGNLEDLTLTPSGSPSSSQILTFTGTNTNMINVTVTGDISAGTISSNNLPLTVVNGAINNAKVNANAAIAQSKLAMNAADTFVESTGWEGSKTQADLGLAKFSANNFETAGGFVRIRDNGIVLAELQQIASGTVLGNNSGSVGQVTPISLSNIVDSGGAIKKGQYTSTGFLRRTNSSSNVNDSDYSVVDMSAIYNSSANSTLVQRDTSGNFGANVVTLEQLNIGNGLSNNSLIVRTVAGTGGTIRYAGFNNAGGLLVGGGSNATDRNTKYLNDSHVFRNSGDTANAPITASQIQVAAITTGGNTAAGTITGRWTLTGSSPNESRLQATYSADLAEYYEGDKEYEVGTVLVFGGDKEVTLSNKQADTRVAGVVSNTAAFVMYDACPGHKNLVALQGRVPCRVVGKIRKGDLLVTSRIPGVAVATEVAQAGTIVGKALENYDSDHIGTIEVAVGRN